MTNISFLPAEKYFQEITEKISVCGKNDQVALMSMGFNPAEPLVEKLMAEVLKASQRGAKVNLVIDAFSFMVHDVSGLPNGPIITSGNYKKARRSVYKNKLAVLEKLHQNGVNWQLINYPRSRISNPFGGRSHIKYTVIDTCVYLGGCNLNHTESSDLMARIIDAKTAGWIRRFILKTAENGSVLKALKSRDLEYEIDEQNKLLIDAGAKNQSKIYDQALKLIDQAEKNLVITCQFFPGRKTGKHLEAALARGVKVKIFYNHPHQGEDFKRPFLKFVQKQEQLARPAEFFNRELPLDQPYLHAKLLASEKAAMIGSHNYVVQGVKYGTAETALLTRDKNAIKKITTWAESLGLDS